MSSPTTTGALQALIFDVDGTLADTENAHRTAFNRAFADLGLGWVWDTTTYTQLLEISGGKERILHYWKQVQPDLKDISDHGSAITDTVNRLHEIKTAAYKAAVHNGEVPMRLGVLQLIESAHASGVRLAIATTTSPVNISALLCANVGADWEDYFAVIEDAKTAPTKKPHPQVYLQTLKRLQLPASACLALEDSSNGLRAATAAGLATIVTPNHFTAHHDFTGALRIVPNLATTTLEHLRAWHHEYGNADQR